MSYVDISVTPVPTKTKDQYIEMSKHMAAKFRALGATSVSEYWGNDVPDGEVTSMPMAVALKPDETVVVSEITWESKEERDEGWEKLMKDPEVQDWDMPFDGKRMIFGGFDIIVEE